MPSKNSAARNGNSSGLNRNRSGCNTNSTWLPRNAVSTLAEPTPRILPPSTRSRPSLAVAGMLTSEDCAVNSPLSPSTKLIVRGAAKRATSATMASATRSSQRQKPSLIVCIVVIVRSRFGVRQRDESISSRHDSTRNGSRSPSRSRTTVSDRTRRLASNRTSTVTLFALLACAVA